MPVSHGRGSPLKTPCPRGRGAVCWPFKGVLTHPLESHPSEEQVPESLSQEEADRLSWSSGTTSASQTPPARRLRSSTGWVRRGHPK